MKRVLVGLCSSLLFCIFGPVARADVEITINIADQSMTVDVDGSTVHEWDVSTGRSGYRTPTGSYRPYLLKREHYSSKYDDAPMPNSIFFLGGYAIHGSYSTRSLGSPASHGCVRLHPRNAARLFSLVEEHGRSNTRIVIER